MPCPPGIRSGPVQPGLSFGEKVKTVTVRLREGMREEVISYQEPVISYPKRRGKQTARGSQQKMRSNEKGGQTWKKNFIC
jgi:hypothetical protein